MRWLSYLNIAMVFTIGLIGIVFFSLPNQEKEPLTSVFNHLPQTQSLPKNIFLQPEDNFHELSETPFDLVWVAPQMQLPDLRTEVIYYGKNERPDAAADRACFHLALKSSNEERTIRENTRTYLVYEGNSSSGRGRYIFSPDNQPTSLWLKLSEDFEGRVQVGVNMLDDKGTLIATPEELCVFELQISSNKPRMLGWDLGGFRVDSTLLVRQKARWIGPDEFLNMHGGEEFAFASGRQRVDFFNQETPYSLFVGQGDFLIWKDERWQLATEGVETLDYPLMVVNKVDEKVLTVDLWDPNGRGKTPLTLIRAKDRTQMPDLTREFMFVGAKTWAQFIVESRTGERLTLRPNDWLVLSQEGWKKLSTPEEIDDYVERKLVGPLFVLDKMVKDNGHQRLVGHLFNAARTEVQEVQLAAVQKTSLAKYSKLSPFHPETVRKLGDQE